MRDQTAKPIIILIISIIIIKDTVARRNVVTGLTQKCPQINSLQNLNEEWAKNLKKKTEDFLKYIQEPKTEKVSNGAFGSIFVFEQETMVDKQKVKKPIAVKAITLYEDFNANEVGVYQKFFDKELDVSLDLNNMDPGHLYFPEYDSCVEVTPEILKLSKKTSFAERELFTVNQHTITFLYFTEKLDRDLFYFNKAVSKGEQMNFTLVSRINFGINTLRGLEKLNVKYNHCDIKPENIMIKKITQEKANELKEAGVREMETMAGFNYQSFIIDFGLVVNRNAKCQGGTMGFLPPEWFNRTSQKKFDAYSVGVMLIDLELMSQDIEDLSTLFGYTQKMKRNGFVNFGPKPINDLNQSKLIKLIKRLLDNEETGQFIKKFALEDLENDYYGLDLTRLKSKLKEGKLSDHLYENVHVFESLVTGAVPFMTLDDALHRKSIEHKAKNDNQIVLLNKKIERLTNLLNQSQEQNLESEFQITQNQKSNAKNSGNSRSNQTIKNSKTNNLEIKNIPAELDEAKLKLSVNEAGSRY